MSKRSRIAKIASIIFSTTMLSSLAGMPMCGASSFDSFADDAAHFSASQTNLAAGISTSAMHVYTGKSQETAKQNKSLDIKIVDIAESVLMAGQDLHVTAVVKNNSDHNATVSNIELVAQTQNNIRSTQIYDWLDGTSYKTKLLTTNPEVNVPAGSQQRVSLTVPAANLPWGRNDTWGVHGIEAHAIAKLDSKEVDISDRSLVVTSNGQATSPMPVNVVVPLTDSVDALSQTPSLFDELTGNVPEAETQRHAEANPEANSEKNSEPDSKPNSEPADVEDRGELTQKIHDYDVDGVHFLVDPIALKSPMIRTALATKQHATADLLPMYDADYAALAHTHQYEIARNIVSSSIAAGQNAINQPGIGYAYLEGNVDQSVLDLVRTSGIPGAIVPSDALSQRNSSYYTPSAHTKLPAANSELDVLVTDSEVNAAISGKLPAPKDGKPLDLDPVDARQASLALTAIHTFQAPNLSRPILISVPRQAVESPQTLTNVQAVLHAPWLSPASFAAMQKSPLSEAKYRALPENAPNDGEFSPKDMENLNQSQALLKQFSSSWVDKKTFADFVEQHSNRLLSTNFRSHTAARSTLLAALSEDSGIFQEIHFQPLSTINMISESAAIPARITNPFISPVQVTVRLKASDSRLFAPQPVKIVIPAKSTTSVSVPVEARGSGNLRVVLSITDDAGMAVGKPMNVDVRVRATWESTGTVIAVVLVAGILVFGLVKSIRKGRRSAPVDPEEFTSKLEAAKLAEEESLKADIDLPKLD
ncbi:DUF6049 family protein [Arcanobacterium bovis]|uniref:Secreted protein n=1 Tax=Arcanobacterium bovis TaxID=2529275 RepID=A0A4Q9UZ61_9ACTO|nr:DUF6049 family protein [Arcanobacterium bovis]TBW21023.1 hypothetical protein EZJ44_06850 [Arcanobacterium bovis]